MLLGAHINITLSGNYLPGQSISGSVSTGVRLLIHVEFLHAPKLNAYIIPEIL
jgi:hypothetical protein